MFILCAFLRLLQWKSSMQPSPKLKHARTQRRLEREIKFTFVRLRTNFSASFRQTINHKLASIQFQRKAARIQQYLQKHLNEHSPSKSDSFRPLSVLLWATNQYPSNSKEKPQELNSFTKNTWNIHFSAGKIHMYS